MQRGLFFVVCSWLSIIVNAQTFPTGFSRVAVGGTISNPAAMAFAPDGRIFVAEQGGNLRVIKDGTLLTTPFVSLTVNASGERGLIGIAFDPDFATNNYIYLYYTVNTAPIHNRISRFVANGDVVTAASETVILELDNLSSATNHNGGAIAFGPDGKLYVAIGDNASGANAQNLDTYHGKILRINKDGSAPSDNPFPTGSEQRKRVWSYGLRNPFTFNIQPGSGRILVNDVGEITTEEVNDATTGGRNFGWPATEGATTNPAYTTPVFTYAHSGTAPTGCAVTGGVFFSPSSTNWPSTYAGKYFIMDYCGGWIYYFDPTVSSPIATLFGSSVGGSGLALTLGPDGNIYYLSRANSRVYRLVYTPPVDSPVITQHPASATITAGQQASFSVTATGAQPLTYQWQKNNVNISGATSSTYNISNVQSGDAGNFRVIVSNSLGTATSNAATLTVTPAPIAPTITVHPQPLTVEAGKSATFSVTATGSFPISYQWLKNGTPITFSTGAQHVINAVVAGDAGNYSVRVINAGGTLTSNEAALTVTPANQKPTATITSPARGSFYKAGTSIVFAGTGVDPEQGELAASAFKWNIDFHHDTHKHDQPAITNLKNGSFDVPNRGELSSNVYYRIILTVTDAQGLTSKDSVDVKPLTSTLTFTTIPPGLPVSIDGQPVTTPATRVSVEGMLRDIAAPSTATTSSGAINFQSWSTGGAATQTIVTPTDDQTYTATYVAPTGLEDVEREGLVYPTPASSWIYIKGNDWHSISATTTLGKTFHLTPVALGEATGAEISHLPVGLYILQFANGDSRGTKKIIVLR